MRAGYLLAISMGLDVAMTMAAQADGIVRIVNASTSDVTVRMDGAFGCRAPARPTGGADSDLPNTCSFGAADGSHALEFHYDDGRGSTKAVSITPAGLRLTLTGNQ